MGSYIFPDAIANVMKKVDQRTQYEASMLSMTMMMVGLILSVVYAIIYIDLQLWFKITLIINGLFGILFMWSSVVTTFQQYETLKEGLELMKALKSDSKSSKEENGDDCKEV